MGGRWKEIQCLDVVQCNFKFLQFVILFPRRLFALTDWRMKTDLVWPVNSAFFSASALQTHLFWCFCYAIWVEMISVSHYVARIQVFWLSCRGWRIFVGSIWTSSIKTVARKTKGVRLCRDYRQAKENSLVCDKQRSDCHLMLEHYHP